MARASHAMVNREDVAVGGGTVVSGAAAVAVAASTSEAGPILAFVAALMVALVTTYTTNRRQQRSLDQERDRLATQLRQMVASRCADPIWYFIRAVMWWPGSRTFAIHIGL
jgi:hypothetical protein